MESERVGHRIEFVRFSEDGRLTNQEGWPRVDLGTRPFNEGPSRVAQISDEVAAPVAWGRPARRQRSVCGQSQEKSGHAAEARIDCVNSRQEACWRRCEKGYEYRRPQCRVCSWQELDTHDRRL